MKDVDPEVEGEAAHLATTVGKPASF